MKYRPQPKRRKPPRHKFPPSTFGVEKAGVGLTITRANLALQYPAGIPDPLELPSLKIADLFVRPAGTAEARHISRVVALRYDAKNDTRPVKPNARFAQLADAYEDSQPTKGA